MKIAYKIRIWTLVFLTLTAMALCGIRLMKLQIVQGEEFLEKSKSSTLGSQTIKAARGEIVDSKGVAIVRNKVGFNVIIEKAFFPSDLQKQNEIILKLAKMLEADGVQWVESIPITKTTPYEYLENRDKDIATMRDDNHLRLAVYATADDCIAELVKKYKIADSYTDEEKRIIAGIRYEMLLKDFSVSNRYTFAEDVPMNTVAKIKELSYNFPGVDIVEEAIRVYEQGDILPHEIGTVGPIYAEEYKELKDKGYGYNDVIGKSGIEKAMEQYLRGEDGTRQITISNGEVTSVEVTKEAIPGNTVQLTVDSKFQAKLQQILENHINWLHTQEKGRNAYAGAVVVLNAKTGAVLGMVNYPTYNINDYINNYSEVAGREHQPLINRAIDGLYRPGSTFKTVTATAAMNEGIVTGEDTVVCNHVYTFYHDISPKCLGWHGAVNVVKALQVSCNIYFYDVGRRLGIDKLTEYAGMYGLGQDLDFELGGAQGYLACPATFDRFGMDWTPGQVLQAAIGQSEIAVSPLQMAVQAMTIANKGVRYKPYIVDSIHTYNMEKTIKETQPEVVSKIDIKYSKLYDYIEEGMILASQSTFGEYSLTDLPYKVAIKTGTPQRTAEKTDSAFIGYYPVGNPEIAFAGIVEEGEYSKYMIRKIIDAYYGYDEIKAAQTSETAAQTQTLPQASETTAQTTPANAQTSQSQPAAETTFVQDVQRNEED